MQTREPGSPSRWARVLVSLSGMVVPLAALLLFSVALADRPSPEEWTRTSMGACAYRASLFYRRTHALPASLTQLPPRRSHHDILLDDWGHPLIYRKTGETTFTLTSFGADGREGGSGDGADIEERYSVDPATGRLVDSP
jgi:hypothetical protein